MEQFSLEDETRREQITFPLSEEQILIQKSRLQVAFLAQLARERGIPDDDMNAMQALVESEWTDERLHRAEALNHFFRFKEVDEEDNAFNKELVRMYLTTEDHEEVEKIQNEIIARVYAKAEVMTNKSTEIERGSIAA